MAVEVEASAGLVYRAAWLKDQGRSYAYESAQAKFACRRVVSPRRQRSGSSFRRVRLLRGLPGRATLSRLENHGTLRRGRGEIHRLVIARGLLDPNTNVWETNR